jgi:predicted transglutaminase-like cysteine proteinase
MLLGRLLFILTVTLGADAAPRIYMEEGKPVLAPYAHVVFCLKYSLQCVVRGDADMVDLTPDIAALIKSVNETVNHTVTPQNDPEGEDNWDVVTSSGDCEDYAIAKRKELIDKGLSSGVTRLAVAVTPDGIGHVVVVVRSNIGDLVLDNRTDEVSAWQNVDLTWLKLQSAHNPEMWVDISRVNAAKTSSLGECQEFRVRACG